MDKKLRRVRVLECPYCGGISRVQRAVIDDGIRFPLTYCNHCFMVVNTDEVKSWLEDPPA